MLLDVACNRFVTCTEYLSGASAPSNLHKACVDKQKTAYDCSQAKSVKSSYDRCIAEVKDFTCEIYLTEDSAGNVQITLPNSCIGVVNTN